YSLGQVDGVDFGTGMAGALGGLMSTRVYMRGTLTPTPGSTHMRLIVNGRRVTVPVAQAHGSFEMQGRKVDGEFFVLDDAQHPLLLKVVVGKSAFQMIRVDFPDGGSVAKTLAAELASRCRAEIPGVYFDFGTADLRPESSDALADVGRVMTAHPDWKLSVEGHTDAIGAAGENLALSQRRAEAVKTTLITRYRVPPSQVTATGFGQTKPKEPNTTIEGRARNRRVELVRSCPGRS
ncbi:MAG: OmpA family protein, partial [Gemmatimonadales bacterium]